MTCIAWDGKTLAADKRATCNGLARTITKIRMCGEWAVAVSGNADQMQALFAWVEDGAKPSDWPKFQADGDDYSFMVVVKPDRTLWLYERTPHPWKCEDATFASGSGRDYAMAAMYLGKSAKEAVEVACALDVNCGNGVDCIEF